MQDIFERNTILFEKSQAKEPERLFWKKTKKQKWVKKALPFSEFFETKPAKVMKMNILKILRLYRFDLKIPVPIEGKNSEFSNKMNIIKQASFRKNKLLFSFAGFIPYMKNLKRRILPMRPFLISGKIPTGRKGIIFLSAFLLISCGDSEVHIDSAGILIEKSSSQRLDPDERALIAVNDLFSAVIDNKNPKEIEEILLTSGNSFHFLNKKGDTPLGTAIKLQREDLALLFLDKLQCEDLYHQNNKQESYIYLASKHGYPNLINRIADTCYERKKPWTVFSDYEFSDLDPETAEEERAVHSAYNHSVMEALSEEYSRGFGEYPWWAFHKTNTRGETFFHTAVKKRRDSVLEWGVETYCHKNSWEESDNLLKWFPAGFLRYSWHIPQTHIPLPWDFDLNFTQLINAKDEEGNTALHLAGKALDTTAVRILSSCRWMDYSLENKLGNIPLQEFLTALDPAIPDHSKEIKSAFTFLVTQRTYLTEWYDQMFSVVDHQNEEGDSALHLSAVLADEFFYNHLTQFGDEHLPNTKEQTPQALFKNFRRQLQE